MNRADIVSMQAALAAMNEAKLDPVDKKANQGKFGARDDKDIDNDGDVDNSDKYLHKRRKKVTQVADTVNELSKKTLGSYVKKANADANNLNYQADRNYRNSDNSPYKSRAGNDHEALGDKNAMKARQRRNNANKAVDRLTKESLSAMDRYKLKLSEMNGQEPIVKVTGPALSNQRSTEIRQTADTSPTKDSSKLAKPTAPPIVDGEKAIDDNRSAEKASATLAAKPQEVDVNKKPTVKEATRFGRVANPETRKPISMRDALAMMEDRGREDHYKGATKPQEYDDNWSASAKKFASMHPIDPVEVADVNKAMDKNKQEVGLSLQRAQDWRHNDSKIGDKTQPGNDGK
jgi:hypothetical protein